MSSITRNIGDFILANYGLALPLDIELAEADDGAITVSIRVRQYTTARALRQLIPYAVKWRDAAYRWNRGYRKDGELNFIESINGMHTSAGGKWSNAGIAKYLCDVLELRLRLGEWDEARSILIDTLSFSETEADEILNDIARPRIAEGLPPFPDEYPPVTAEKVKRRLRTWRKIRAP